MDLAILGATGRTGAHGLTAALARGHEVSVLVRDAAKLPGGTADRVRVVVGDSTDPAVLTDLLAGALTARLAVRPGPSSGQKVATNSARGAPSGVETNR